ncbi:MAG: alpha/beta hydrolase-fold protein, partial [Myxococcales bacterium]
GRGTAGGNGTGGASAGSGGMGGARVLAKAETTIPAQYRNPVANPGKWTAKMYPAYYHGSGAAGAQLPKSATAIMKPCNVYTPPDYDPTKEYPLIFALHGYPDNQNTWYERPNPKPTVLMDNLITAKVIQPVIAVFPLGSATGNSNDTGGYTAFGSEMMGDLVPFIEANYKIKKGRDNRAIAGFSYGGMQTINVFLCFYLKEFSWFAALSPVSEGSSAIAACLEKEDPKMYPVNYLYIHAGTNELASGSAKGSADGLTMKSPYITSANFTYLVTALNHEYNNSNVGLYNILRIAFPY